MIDQLSDWELKPVGEVVIGREQELAVLTRLLDDARKAPVAMLLEGEAGIGKSILWRHVLGRPGPDRLALVSHPTASDADLSFAVLNDLLDPVLEEALPALADPRRRALQIALLRMEPGDDPPEPEGVALAALDVLRHLAATQPLLLAVDDTQWIDPSSARVLRFALRRLEDEPVALLLTARAEGDDDVPVPFHGPQPPVRLRLGPLSVAAIHGLVSTRLRTSMPRHIVLRLHEQSGGNPFYALEIARALLRRGMAIGPHDALPIPNSLRDLMAERLAALTPAARRVAVYAASLSRPTMQLLASIDDPAAPIEAVDEATAAGVLDVRGQQLRFTHPLLASILSADTLPTERWLIHANLGRIVADPEERARHIALAAAGTDAAAAAILDDAARHASARGAPDAAAALFEEARRLTPQGEADQARRRGIDAIDHHFRAGDVAAAEGLVEEMLPSAAEGSDRAGLLSRLATIRGREYSFPEAERLLQAAAPEAEGDARLGSAIQQELAFARMHGGDMPGAVSHARAALALAERVGDEGLIASSVIRLASFEFIIGMGVRGELLARAKAFEARARESGPVEHMFDPGMVIAYMLKASDDFEAARARFEDRRRYAVQRGNESGIPFILSHVSELEYWAGNWDLAAREAAEGLRIARQCEQAILIPVMQYCSALVDAGRGNVESARRTAEEARRSSELMGIIPVMAMALSALGFIDLSVGDLAGTHECLGEVAQSMAAMGTGEPGGAPFHGG